MGRSIRGEVRTRWPRNTVYKEFIHVDGTGTAAITKGGQYATLSDEGTGDYDITLTYPAAQLLHASVTAVGSTARHCQIGAISGSVINVLAFDLATPTAADADFVLELTLSDKQREY